MGNVQASNTLDTTIDSAISILNNSTQSCPIDGTQIEIIDLTNCSAGGDITISNVDFGQGGSFNLSCAQTSSSSSDISQKLDQNFRQGAMAISQALSLNLNSTTSENILKSMLNLSSTIQNSYVQDCTVALKQEQAIKCTDTTAEGNITITNINFRQFQESATSCVQQSQNVNSIKSEIKQIIDQQATSKVEPIFSLGGIVLVIVLVIIFLIVFSVNSTYIILIAVGLIILGIGIYLAIAYIRGFFPFSRSDQVDNSGVAPTNNNTES